MVHPEAYSWLETALDSITAGYEVFPHIGGTAKNELTCLCLPIRQNYLQALICRLL